MQDLMIFANLEAFFYFGSFGNANIRYTKDWKQVNIDTTYSNLGQVSYNNDTKTC